MNKIRVLVTLANHNLPPKSDTPGIGKLISRQLQEMDYDKYEINTLSINTDTGDYIKQPKYNYVLIRYKRWAVFLLTLLPRKIRHLLFGITDANKIYRNLLIFFNCIRSINKYDIIIVHNYPLTAIWLCEIRNLFNPHLKIVYYYHSSDIHWFLNMYPKLKKVSGIITIAGEILTETHHCNIINNHVRVISNQENKKNKVLKLISTSNIDSNKGILHIIDAVEKLHDNDIDVTLDLFGKEKESNYFKTVLSAIKNKNYICYKGPISNNELLHRLQQYDIMILFSQHKEGNSMAMIEAIVEGRIPVIASNVGGNPVVLNQEKFGKLINYYNNSKELFLTLMEFIEKPFLLEQYKTNINNLADDYFSPTKSAYELSNFLERIIEKD